MPLLQFPPSTSSFHLFPIPGKLQQRDAKSQLYRKRPNPVPVIDALTTMRSEAPAALANLHHLLAPTADKAFPPASSGGPHEAIFPWSREKTIVHDFGKKVSCSQQLPLEWAG